MKHQPLQTSISILPLLSPKVMIIMIDFYRKELSISDHKLTEIIADSHINSPKSATRRWKTSVLTES